jgi:hypothetical protein
VRGGAGGHLPAWPAQQNARGAVALVVLDARQSRAAQVPKGTLDGRLPADRAPTRSTPG